MQNEQFKFASITRSIIGCAMAVHNQLGNGFQELIYHRALAIEMTKQGLRFQDEVEVVIFYDGIAIGKRRVDFLVESVIPVEIKAVKELENIHLAQAINYLKAYKMEVGLLINFGSMRLQFHRILKPRLG
ncbi:GxxExxY protein [Sediminibacterium goheungense]|uniref:GxxExxY protein n=1 Tax=Sediminibacterium goheungense TaxID=1086393 RepID=A0A4R6IXR5_9BACT|nr:GxxExxY protein [Sediminibacterium goheungense]TDO26776.1 GxxExxY protein [Sediminibacterium goheungense]